MSGEVEALHAIDDELTHQIETMDQELQSSQDVFDSFLRKRESLESEAEELTRRAEENRRRVHMMRHEMQSTSETEVVHSEWVAKKNILDEVLKREKHLKRQVHIELPSRMTQEARVTAEALAEILKFIDVYVSPVTQRHATLRSSAETRIDPLHLIQQTIPAMIEFSEQRERVLHQLCCDVDYRNAESNRLETSTGILSHQKEGETVDAMEQKERQLRRITDGMNEERNALLRVKARLETEAKEVEYHIKRGTMSRRSTKLSGEEGRLYDVVSAQTEQNKKLLQQFEALRSEKMQLEREAEQSLQRLLRGREEQAKQKAQLRLSVDEIRQFSEQLREEQRQWLAMKRDMNELLILQQRKIRTQTAQQAAIVR